MTNSISELLRSGENDPITGEAITLIHRSKIIPTEGQDRDDWDNPETIANIQSIRKSAQIKIEDGRYFGIRYPLFVGSPDENGNFPIIDGECRWRSVESLPEELQMLPCIVRTGSKKEQRLDHTASNGARKGLTLFQTAMSIQRDEKEFGLTTEEIIAVHGLPNQTALSKYKAIHKLGDRAKELVRSGTFQDVNLVYELKKLDDDQLTKLEKRIAKGESIQQAIKALIPKEPKQPKEQPKSENKTSGDADENGAGDGKEAGAGDLKLSDSESSISLTIGLNAAKALAALLDVPVDLAPKSLQAALVEAIKGMASDLSEGAE